MRERGPSFQVAVCVCVYVCVCLVSGVCGSLYLALFDFFYGVRKCVYFDRLKTRIL